MDFSIFLFLSLLTLLHARSSASADGCYWSGACYNMWLSSCGTGRMKVDQSDDCNGLCPAPQYPACNPFTSRIMCCNEETPIASDDCARCGSRVEVGNHWMCCSDCTEPKMVNHELKTGFCRSGAQLSIQPKAQEVFRWMSRDWTECSGRCGDGMRSRTVRCVGSLEYAPQHFYYVNDTKCDALKMPLREESCRKKSCSRKVVRHHKHRRGLHLWAKVIIFGLTSMAVAGLGVGGYVLYKRRKDSMNNHGFVYVMLDNYS